MDRDLEKSFHRVNHDLLVSRVARKVKEKRLLLLIRRYLQARVMINGFFVATEEGTPHVGPLSSLLANIMLDERRGITVSVRYADDCNIYVGSRRGGERVMESVRRFVEGKLKLKVNIQKSAVDRSWKRKLLRVSFTQGRKP